MLELVQALRPFGADGNTSPSRAVADAVDFHIAFYIGRLAAGIRARRSPSSRATRV
jgi:hypothetical protein